MKKAKRPSKLDELAIATKQDWSHQNSVVISSKRALLEFEVAQIDAKLIALSGAITAARARRAKLNAMILGLGLVLDKR